jgi:hypothetical protein
MSLGADEARVAVGVLLSSFAWPLTPILAAAAGLASATG